MTYLDDILAWHRRRAAADTREVAALRERMVAQREARTTGSTGRSFTNALTASNQLAVIAEIKRRSPSKGDLDGLLNPAVVAHEYERGGAACLSVLTDVQHFGGSADDLRAARAAVSLPVLRKDFVVSEVDILDAVLMGADAVLLIVAALTDEELRSLHALSTDCNLAALVEVHDEAELDRALAVGARVVGVNQRDLRTFDVDVHRAERVAARIPGGVIAVAESGITSRADAQRCAAAGYRAVLVGEHLVRSVDRAKSVSELRVALPS
ncbi:MAG: indole-3-glycerol phosphate synthase TrpC [Actinomycetota bacterium]